MITNLIKESNQNINTNAKLYEAQQTIQPNIHVFQHLIYPQLFIRDISYTKIITHITTQTIIKDYNMLGNETRVEKIAKLLEQPSKIRNISVVAHVDHGKTTLVDNLISSNGIISKKLAGKLKYMDSRIDEQDRGITMKSSSISLVTKHKDEQYLVNLIDSPGHVEFGFQVEAALRLTDGALVVVDVLEGVSSQTYRVLMQTFEEKVSSILVLNKIDKLIRQKQMTPLEAYRHLNQLIQQVNALIGSFINLNSQKYSLMKHKSSRQLTEDEIQDKKLGELENQFYFEVEKHNVIFCSAVDNWGFSTKQFVPLISKKLGVEEKLVEKHLWGDYYYYPKTKTFSTQPKNQNDKPLCVDFVLQTIWQVYDKVFAKDTVKIDKIISVLGLKVNQKTKQVFDYPLIKEILMNWIPLDKAVFSCVINSLPSPVQAQKFRLPILYPLSQKASESSLRIKQAIENCQNTEQSPLVVFVSKIISIPKSHFNQRGLQELNPGQENKSLGFARIYSGRLKRNQKVFVIGPKAIKTVVNGETVHENDVTQTTIDNIYLLMGQYPEGLPYISAGSIFGIGNLQNIIFKTGTVSNIAQCQSLSPSQSHSKAILKVSISTPNLQNMGKVVQGLKKLNKSDPSVEVYVETNGDIILSTCGEVHLQRCVSDLESIFAKVPVKYSDPIINFRQTIVWQNPLQNNNQKYIQQLEAKKKQELKKQLRERLKKQAMEDAQIDDDVKEKLKMIEDWEIGVEKYDADDFTVEDTRYFLKSKEDQDKEPEKYDYRNQKQIKKVDHKNRNKTQSKERFLNLTERTNVVTTRTPNNSLQVQVKALGFSFEVSQFLQKNRGKIKQLFDNKSNQIQIIQRRISFLQQLDQIMKENKIDKHLYQMIMSKFYCFGPNQSGPNLLLINCLKPQYSLYKKYAPNSSLLQESQPQTGKQEQATKNQIQFQNMQNLYKDYNITENQLISSIMLGFDMATQSGPVCEQPMMGVCFIINSLKYIKAEQQKEEKKQEKQNEVEKKQQTINIQKQNTQQPKKQQNTQFEGQSVQTKQNQPSHVINSQQNKTQVEKKVELEEQKQEETSKNKPQTKQKKQTKDSFGPMVGQVISQIKQACLISFMGASPRLVEPVYECNLQTQEDYYGNVHGELSKRRAKILEQDLHESSNLFLIKAHLPVVQSFGFCSEMRTKTQGRVNAQLHFDTWKIYDLDPFYVPLSKQELQQSGIESLPPNAAKILIDKIRKMKGLLSHQKIVSAPEKQRTLKKK